MPLRVVLHAGHDGEPGVEAWAIDCLGLATWAETPEAVLARLPEKLTEHRALLARHGIPDTAPTGRGEVVESLEGDEILYAWDREPSSPGEVALALRLMDATRTELVELASAAPPAALDWDPPYRRFASWASWRTVRAILAHLANAETHYYTGHLGYACPFDPAPATGDWREFLPRHRTAAAAFLEGVARSNNLARIRAPEHGEHWSLRKCLRRMVRHEIQHTRSIARILAAFARRADDRHRERAADPDPASRRSR